MLVLEMSSYILLWSFLHGKDFVDSFGSIHLCIGFIAQLSLSKKRWASFLLINFYERLYHFRYFVCTWILSSFLRGALRFLNFLLCYFELVCSRLKMILLSSWPLDEEVNCNIKLVSTSDNNLAFSIRNLASLLIVLPSATQVWDWESRSYLFRST